MCQTNTKKYYVTGLGDLGRILLEKFKWGDSFFTLNRELLDDYAGCKTSMEVVAVQQKYLEALELQRNELPEKGNMILGNLSVSGV